MNTIELQGQIRAIYKGSRNTIVTLFVRNRRINFPQVVFSGYRRSLIDGSGEDGADGFSEGDYVRISGLLKTRGIVQEDGRILHTQFIRGDDIILLDEPEEGERFDFLNEGKLVGKIMRSTANNNMVTLLVRPDDENFNVWAFKYTDNAEEEAEKFAVGSIISAKCEMQTVRKTIRGEVKHFENFVITEAEVR